VYGDPNSLACPAGYSAITDQAGCEAAAVALGASFGGFSFSGAFPVACHLRISTFEITGGFGASCSGSTCSGKANPDAKLVCAVGAPTGPLPDAAAARCHARSHGDQHTHCVLVTAGTQG
jgi:hypothetical protein